MTGAVVAASRSGGTLLLDDFESNDIGTRWQYSSTAMTADNTAPIKGAYSALAQGVTVFQENLITPKSRFPVRGEVISTLVTLSDTSISCYLYVNATYSGGAVDTGYLVMLSNTSLNIGYVSTGGNYAQWSSTTATITYPSVYRLCVGAAPSTHPTTPNLLIGEIRDTAGTLLFQTSATGGTTNTGTGVSLRSSTTLKTASTVRYDDVRIERTM